MIILVLLHIMLLLYTTVGTNTPAWHKRQNESCSLMEHVSAAECVEREYRLLCNRGITYTLLKRIQYHITYLRLVEWPGECLNVHRLQHNFPALHVLELINCTKLKTLSGHFDAKSKIEKLTMHGMTSLWEVSSEVVRRMKELKEIDFRNNMLRHIRERLIKEPPRLERVWLSDNKWDCSDGGLDWLAMENDNGTVKRRIVDYYKLVCHQQLYRGKPLHKVMDIIRMVRLTCPEPCACAMTHVVSDRAGAVIPLITVDCAGKRLLAPPATLPPRTTTLRLEGNKINTIRMIIQNTHYQKLADLYLDNNSISAVKELEGSEWFSTFRVLSLRGNRLKQIPVYAFDKAFQSNNNIMHVFLGHNPWRCDCHFIPRFQSLLQKYKRVIRDLPDIKCSKSSDQTISMVQKKEHPNWDISCSLCVKPVKQNDKISTC